MKCVNVIGELCTVIACISLFLVSVIVWVLHQNDKRFPIDYVYRVNVSSVNNSDVFSNNTDQ